jgi:hypothetical protein
LADLLRESKTFREQVNQRRIDIVDALSQIAKFGGGFVIHVFSLQSVAHNPPVSSAATRRTPRW